jgi:hypothetical protein
VNFFSFSKPATTTKKLKLKFYLKKIIIFIFIFRVRADNRGEGEGGGEGGREKGGEGGASVRMLGCVRTDSCACTWMHVRVRAGASVLPQVTSKKTLQCVQVTDAPAAIVRLSVRYRPRDNPGKDRRRQVGLCFYFGSSKHKLLECPIKPKGLKAQSATSMESGTLKNRDVLSE